VADVVEVVLPLLCPVSERCFRRHALLQITSLGWQVEENPMDPGATGSVGIIADKGDALGPGRRFGPAQWRRLVRPIAGVLLRDGFARFERRAGYFDGHRWTS